MQATRKNPKETSSNAIGLFGFYGFEPIDVRLEEKRIRFSNGWWFVDLWNGRRGFVMSVFRDGGNPKYYYRVNYSQMEDVLIKLKHH